MPCFLIFFMVFQACQAKFPTFLIINDNNDIRLVDVASNRSSSHNTTYLIDRLQFIIVLDADIQAGLVFYVNDKDQLIVFPINRPQDAEPTQITFTELNDAFCVDWVTKKVYWSDREMNRIEFASYKNFLRHKSANKFGPVGVTKKDFVRRSIVHKNIHHIMGLSIDPLNGFLFYINSIDRHSIERIWLDGSHRVIIYTLRSGITLVPSLALDYVRKRVYFSDGVAIFFMDYDGQKEAAIVSEVGSINSLAVFEDFLFWSNNTGIYSLTIDVNDRFHLLNNRARSIRRLVSDLNPGILRVFDAKKQIMPSDIGKHNPCLTKQNNCSDICIYVPVEPFMVCSCPTGIRLNDDARTCPKTMSKVLLLARRHDLRMISLATSDFTDQILPIDSTQDATAVEYDHLMEHVYWSDSELNVIKRAKLDGTDENVLIADELGLCDGLAIDWLARNIYWTDRQLQRIEVARLDGSARRVIVSFNVKTPRGIAVDPIRGFLYWTDWSEDEPRLEMSLLDGSERKILLALEPYKHFPNGLALDIAQNQLYYADARSDQIVRVNASNSSDILVVYTIEQSHSHIFGLSYLDDHLYWSDWPTRKLMRAEKDGTASVVMQDNLADLMGVKAVDLKHNPGGSNPCSKNNGNCSHFCFFLPSGHFCECPSYLELSNDNKTCRKSPGYLLYSQKDPNNLIKISLNHSNAKSYRLPLTSNANILVMDYLWNEQILYFPDAEKSYRVLKTTSLNGSQERTLLHLGISTVHSLAVDWIGRNVYFSDSFYDSINVVSKNGHHWKSIIWNAGQPRDLALYPQYSHIYWTDVSDNSVYRALFDGYRVETVLQSQTSIHAITIDYVSSLLYLATDDALLAVNLKITLNDLNPSDASSNRYVRRIIQSVAMKPTSLTIYDDTLYWIDSSDRKIKICLRSRTCTSDNVLQESSINGLLAIMAVYGRRQESSRNICSPTSCSHLCFSVFPGSENVARKSTPFPKCICETHYIPDSSGGQCEAPRTFLLFTQNSTVYRTVPAYFDPGRRHNTHGHNTEPPVPIYGNNSLAETLMLGYDPSARNLLVLALDDPDPSVDLHIISDSGVKDGKTWDNSFVKFFAGHSSVKVIYDPYSACMFAIPTNNGLLATTASYVSILKINYQQTHKVEYKGALLKDAELNLVDFAVDGRRGLLYLIHRATWSPHSNSSIYRCSLSPSTGSQWPNVDHTGFSKCRVLRANVTGSINAISVDLVSGSLLWITSPLINAGAVAEFPKSLVKTILYKMTFDESDPNIPIEERRNFSKFYSDLAVLNNFVYLVSPKEYNRPNTVGTIDFTSLDFSNSDFKDAVILHKAVVDEYSKIMPVHESIFEEVRRSPCLKNYCSHFCSLRFHDPSGYECSCPIGMTIGTNGKTCEKKIPCDTPNQLPCATSSRCFDANRACDSQRDCADGSDEWPALCTCPKSLKDSSVMSMHPQNVARYWPFRCHNHRHLCLTQKQYCDGHVDCPDGADEALSVCKCPPHFRVNCTSLRTGLFSPCIPRNQWCNRVNDCQDALDELGCFTELGTSSAHFRPQYITYLLLGFILCLAIFASLFYLRLVRRGSSTNRHQAALGGGSRVALLARNNLDGNIQPANLMPSTTHNLNINLTNNSGPFVAGLDNDYRNSFGAGASINEPTTITTNIELSVYPSQDPRQPYFYSTATTGEQEKFDEESDAWDENVDAQTPFFIATNQRQRAPVLADPKTSSSSTSGAHKGVRLRNNRRVVHRRRFYCSSGEEASAPPPHNSPVKCQRKMRNDVDPKFGGSDSPSLSSTSAAMPPVAFGASRYRISLRQSYHQRPSRHFLGRGGKSDSRSEHPPPPPYASLDDVTLAAPHASECSGVATTPPPMRRHYHTTNKRAGIAVHDASSTTSEAATDLLIGFDESSRRRAGNPTPPPPSPDVCSTASMPAPQATSVSINRRARGFPTANHRAQRHRPRVKISSSAATFASPTNPPPTPNDTTSGSGCSSLI